MSSVNKRSAHCTDRHLRCLWIVDDVTMNLLLKDANLIFLIDHRSLLNFAAHLFTMEWEEKCLPTSVTMIAKTIFTKFEVLLANISVEFSITIEQRERVI